MQQCAYNHELYANPANYTHGKSVTKVKRFLTPAILIVAITASLILVPTCAAATVEETLLAYLNAHRDEILADWMELVQIPAKSKQEEKRAAWVQAKFKEVGLTDIKSDAMLNTSGFLAGKPGDKTVLIAAHMDTVFENDTPLALNIKDGRLHCPGAGDDTPSVVGLVWLAKAIKETGISLPFNLLLVATAQEELGVRGMTFFMDNIDRKIDNVIAVDGSLGGVTAGARGAKWVHATFTTPGGHTNSSTGKPSAMRTLAAAIDKVYKYQVAQEPAISLNCGVVKGGTVPNAICESVTLTIDMRSGNGLALKTLSANVFAALQAAADETGAQFTYEIELDVPAGVLPGAAEHPLTVIAMDVQKELGFANPQLGFAGSNDAAVGVGKGIPSIAVGMTKFTGGHGLAEATEIESVITGMKQIVMIVSRM